MVFLSLSKKNIDVCYLNSAECCTFYFKCLKRFSVTTHLEKNDFNVWQQNAVSSVFHVIINDKSFL